MAKLGQSLQQLAAEIQRRSETKKDLMVPVPKLGVDVIDDKPMLVVHNGKAEPFEINDFCHGQVAEFAGIPMAYYRRMLQHDPMLLASNINRWLREEAMQKQSRMLRTLDGRARALLSPSYRPLDYEQLAETVLPILLEMDLLIISCDITERRLYIKAIDKRVERDVPTGRKIGDGSHVFFDTVSPGITIGDSEVGAGALYIETGVYTHMCTNLAMFGRNMRRYHTGKRAELSDEVYAMLTDDTKRATDQAIWMQTRDMVKSAFERATFDATCEKLENAAKDVVPAEEVVQVIERVGRRYNLLEAEGKGILARLIEGADLTRYGVHAAITRFSQDEAVGYDRASELEQIGGSVIELPANDWKALVAA